MSQNYDDGCLSGCLGSLTKFISAVTVLIIVVVALIVVIFGMFGGNSEGSHCCDSAGRRRCPLSFDLPRGTPCFCPGQGNGYTCK